MQNLTLIIFLLFTSILCKAQNPYTQALYNFQSELNINYGTSENYAGNDIDLFLDIYKPLGDDNCKRPVMILVHGGAWVTDSKENTSMQYMSEELAKRGWVVANIDYRLGTNKTDTYTPNVLCNSFTEPCAYICDTMEIERANFRAMQDAKGVIRYMKSRNMLDSTDIDNVFMAGESAGGFISLSTGFTLDASKKPMSCFAIGDAPTPASDLAALPCSDPNNDLSRPDLGDYEGTLHLGTYNSELQGVGSFFGGILDLSTLENVPNPPSVYLFAQGSDAIIHYDYGVMFERISNCLSFCQGYGPYPNAYGSEGIRKYLDSLSGALSFTSDIVANFDAGGNCFGNGHEIDDPALRLQSMVDFFASEIANSSNNPINNCLATSIKENRAFNSVIIQNPVHERINLKSSSNAIGASYSIRNISGRVILKGNIENTTTLISANKLSSGMYLFEVFNESEIQIMKFIKR